MTAENILEYESVKNALYNLALRTGGRLKKKTMQNYKMALTQLSEFVNSEEDLEKTLTPDDLLQEARGDPKKAQVRIVNFFQWLQGYEVPGYRPWIVRGKPHKVRYMSAKQRAHSNVRGFYTNNEITFPKTFRVPPNKEPVALEADTNVPFFRIDEKRGTFYFDRSLMKHFLANLKLRDQAIALGLLSTSQDTGDFFKLTIGWARMQKERERCYWHGNRSKTGHPFKVFFSKEATDYVRTYIDQERQDASDGEHIFVTTGNGGGGVGRVQKPMRPRHIGDIFRDVAKKMGIHDGGEYQNPLRPKRLRHIFRTACTHIHMDEGYMNVFMGHSTNISQRYLEKPVQVLEIEYSKVEPMLTVFEASQTKNLSEIKMELAERKAELLDLRTENRELKLDIQELRGQHLDFKRSVEKRLEQILEKMRGAVEESPS